VFVDVDINENKLVFDDYDKKKSAISSHDTKTVMKIVENY